MNTNREIHKGIGGEMDTRATDQGRRCFEENGGELGRLEISMVEGDIRARQTARPIVIKDH